MGSTASSPAIDIVVSEVGPRDGLQSIKSMMPTAVKCHWIAALAASGLREIEVGSFVSAHRVPQMADTADVVRASLRIPGLAVLVLAPTAKYAARAFEAGVHRVTMPISASRSYSQKNVGMTPEEAVEQVRLTCALRDQLDGGPRRGVEIGISMAFGGGAEGTISEDWVMELAVRIAKAGADSVGLSDSSGSANPVQVKRMFARLRREIGELAGAAHLHNTRGQGLANVVAALEAGVTTFDASQGGIGGSPFAQGATGNIVTEDLVFLLEAMGLKTGVDIDLLLKARALLAAALPGEPLYGHLVNAGVPKGFVSASQRQAR